MACGFVAALALIAVGLGNCQDQAPLTELRQRISPILFATENADDIFENDLTPEDLATKVMSYWLQRPEKLRQRYAQAKKLYTAGSLSGGACESVALITVVDGIVQAERKPEGAGCSSVLSHDSDEFPCTLFKERLLGFIRLIEVTQMIMGSNFSSLEFIACLGDRTGSAVPDDPRRMDASVYNYAEGPLPLFGILSCKWSRNIPLPSFDMQSMSGVKYKGGSNVGRVEDWGDTMKELTKIREKHPWKLRKNKAVFRGMRGPCIHNVIGYDGSAAEKSGFNPERRKEASKCGRIGLEILANYEPQPDEIKDFFDVRVFAMEHEAYLMNQTSRNENGTLHLGFEDQEQYKYRVHIGNMAGWANRLRKEILSGSTLIYQESQCVEWIGLGMQRWKHYVPLSNDLHNMHSIALWLRKHDSLAYSMTKRLNAYAKNNLSPKAIAIYTWAVLTRYASLLQSNK